MASNESYEIPESGAVFTFGRSGFADNQQSHFFIRNDPVVEISCGDEHTAVVCQNGRVFLFGHNDYGQLGLGHTRTVNKPSCLKYLKPFHSTHVACGKSHTIVSTECGRLFSFGSNSDGQLGTGDIADKLTPQMVNTKHFSEGKISAVAAGCFHSACLTGNGELYIWGSNSDGQCGTDVDTNLLIPTKVEFTKPISTISCGYYHTAFISEGNLYTFGEDDNGKLGYKKVKSSNSPEMVELGFKCKHVVCGGNHTILLSEEGKVLSCGSNFSGQLGIGSNAAEIYTFTPVEFPADDIKISQVSAGESHSAFITDLGDLYTCGDGRYGKTCSESETSNSTFPNLITLFALFECVSVSCGGCQTMVLAKSKPDGFDIETAKLSSLPPLKMTKPLNESDAIQTEEPKSPEIVNEVEDKPETLDVTPEDLNVGKEETSSPKPEDNASNFDAVSIDINSTEVEEIKEIEKELEESKETNELITVENESNNEKVESLNENEPDVIVRKESGIKKMFKVFRRSTTSKENSKNGKEKTNEKIDKIETSEHGKRQTSRTCSVI